MIEYTKYFSSKRLIYLNEISYKLITLEDKPINVSFKIKDTLRTEVVEENQLRIIFTRRTHFLPESLYDLSVSFGCVLYFTEDALQIPNYKELDYEGYFIENSQYIGDIISRASMEISQITSSHGQPPVITPPNYIKS